MLKEKFTMLSKIIEYRIWMLLISILLLITVPPFLSSNPHYIDLYVKINFLFIVIACFFIIHHIKWAKYLSLITFLLIIIDQFLGHDILHYFSQVGIAILIFYAFYLVLRAAMSLESDTSDMIIVSVTGYLIIGVIGGFMAEGINQLYPNSYSYSANLELTTYNYIYYSFVTMTTLGYGDIVPISTKAQSMALVLVLAGQLFLSVIIAINISKFMQNKRKAE